jgi:hypothetical protein
VKTLSQTETQVPTSKDISSGDNERLIRILKDVFNYFRHFTDPVSGLVADNGRPGAPASIAVVGLAITCHLIAVRRELISRREAAQYVLRALRFLNNAQDGEETSTGYKGFFFHFMDVRTGARAMDSEVSTIDSGLFFIGALTALIFFDDPLDPMETEIRTVARAIYERADWPWATNGEHTLAHGWRPECGFLPNRWAEGYSEAMFLYVLALGSPTFPIREEGYRQFTDSFRLRTLYDLETIFAGPLFIHQLSHCWIDFRDIDDDFTRRIGFNYFENSRRATLQQRRYAIENPRGFKAYGENFWGISACGGPGPADVVVDGRKIHFFDYIARGVGQGPDDGTISPWATVASLPFAPNEVSEFVKARYPDDGSGILPADCFEPCFNPSFPTRDGHVWRSPYILGLNEGPMMIMIENYLSEMIWDLTKKSEPIRNGLRRAGFSGGWLGGEPAAKR